MVQAFPHHYKPTLGARAAIPGSLKGRRAPLAASLGLALISLAGMSASGAPATAPQAAALDAAAAARFAGLALKCLHEEYPTHLSHTMDSDADASPPHVLTPAFYGCYDWHSDVHGHWLLVRLLRLFADAPFAAAARAALGQS